MSTDFTTSSCRWPAVVAMFLTIGCVQEPTPSPEPGEPTPGVEAPPTDEPIEPVVDAPVPDRDPPPVDAPATDVQYLKAHNAAEWDNFGLAIAVDGDRMAVGATSANVGGPDGGGGAVYIFERDGQGAWVEVDLFTGVDTERYDDFGATVALAGDLLAVGAPSRADASAPDQLRPAGARHTVGAVYLFERQPEGDWRPVAYLRAELPTYGVFFGGSLAFDGERLVVGAPGDFERETEGASGLRALGAVYVFERGADGAWRATARLQPADGRPDALFGHSVALDGLRIVVGAPREGERGAVHVFELVDGGWLDAARLIPPADWDGERFGAALAARDGRVAVGCPATRIGVPAAPPGPGGHTVFVYDAIDDGAEPVVVVGPEETAFGAGLALSDDRLLVGAPLAGGKLYDAGEAWLFAPGEGSWALQARLAAPNHAAHHLFGRAVAFDGAVPVIGAPGESGGPRSTLAAPDDVARRAGAVYAFGGPAD